MRVSRRTAAKTAERETKEQKAEKSRLPSNPILVKNTGLTKDPTLHPALKLLLEEDQSTEDSLKRLKA